MDFFAYKLLEDAFCYGFRSLSLLMLTFTVFLLEMVLTAFYKWLVFDRRIRKRRYPNKRPGTVFFLNRISDVL